MRTTVLPQIVADGLFRTGRDRDQPSVEMAMEFLSDELAKYGLSAGAWASTEESAAIEFSAPAGGGTLRGSVTAAAGLFTVGAFISGRDLEHYLPISGSWADVAWYLDSISKSAGGHAHGQG